MATFRGKAVAVTGGASGIGLATAKLLYEQQALVSIADIDQDALDAVTAYFNNGDPVNCNERIFLKRIDVGNAKEVNEWISETVKRFGRLHGAANVAGVIGKHHGLRNVDELEDDQWDLILRVNLTGMMYSMRAELQHLEDGGSVVCVSSIQGQMGFAKHAAYSASKHGVQGLAKSAAKEYGDRNIRVNLVSPGTIDTPLVRKRNAFLATDPPEAETPLKRMGTSEEVAQTILWLLGDQSSFVTGATIAVDGGWNC